MRPHGSPEELERRRFRAIGLCAKAGRRLKWREWVRRRVFGSFGGLETR